MLLTTLIDPVPIFLIRLKYITGSVYIANVTIHTTGEVLLKNFKSCVGPHNYYSTCKLSYHGKDIQFTDTIEKLGIKEGDLVEAVDSQCKNSTKYFNLVYPTTPTNARSSMLIYLKTSTEKIELNVYWSDTIFQIKEMIQDLKESTLHLESKEIIIYVKTETGEIIKLELTANNTVNDVKLMIQDLKGIAADKHSIILNDVELHDSYPKIL
ncbi:11518_t:CDS:2 [Dentiscutata erythropus]|uniref:11518_t:CDS:1 n=1 Tax=Dentiscutata erythropus TaxID=1348616 RepID=A0A9N9J4Q7_9GLOM|nr:11518_t:CDS:2 [Dentiscutata erythropus]